MDNQKLTDMGQDLLLAMEELQTAQAMVGKANWRVTRTFHPILEYITSDAGITPTGPAKVFSGGTCKD